MTDGPENMLKATVFNGPALQHAPAAGRSRRPACWH